MIDPKASAVKDFHGFFPEKQSETQSTEMFSMSPTRKKSLSIKAQLGKALAKWPGSVNIPKANNSPRLAKRDFRHQSQAGPRP
ncbi:MAG: hypothetical protein AAB627_00320 [Patescibacteria group bacterium]